MHALRRMTHPGPQLLDFLPYIRIQLVQRRPIVPQQLVPPPLPLLLPLHPQVRLQQAGRLALPLRTRTAVGWQLKGGMRGAVLSTAFQKQHPPVPRAAPTRLGMPGGTRR